ncbi:MAG: hypothetical protein NWE76_03360, partial [Candidatus Bathyarchaeota archaeon]|nr:hypothetical protein [Candidatus Bathyarchaeota archaeon]
AGKMKESIQNLFNISPDDIEKWKRDDDWTIEITFHRPYAVHTQLTFREFIQRFGTEAHRDVFGSEFWVEATLPDGFDHEDKIICLSDIRFPNEAERVRELGGTVIRLLDGPLDEDGHASEQILDDSLIDYEIDNSERDDEFENLDKSLKEIVEKTIKTKVK